MNVIIRFSEDERYSKNEAENKKIFGIVKYLWISGKPELLSIMCWLQQRIIIR